MRTLVSLCLLMTLSSCQRLEEASNALAFWREMRAQTLATTKQYHLALAAADAEALCRLTIADACARFRAGMIPAEDRRRQYRDAAIRWKLETFILGPAEAHLYGTYTHEGVLYATVVQLVWSDSRWKVSNPHPMITEY